MIKLVLPTLWKHFAETDVIVSLFSTDWTISMFLNFIPIDLSHIYLGLFFKHGWDVFYEVGI